MGKRDRWDSSSDEEEVPKRPASAPVATADASKPAAATQNGQQGDNKKVSKFDHLPRHNPLLKGCRSVYVSYNAVCLGLLLGCCIYYSYETFTLCCHAFLD